jgi:sulfide:quinone oxidoreductase
MAGRAERGTIPPPDRDLRRELTMRGTNGAGHARVIVAGGGVAALEALLALHELAGRHVRLALLAPGTRFLNRPASVGEPFGLGGAGQVSFAEVARHCDAELHAGTLATVEAADGIAVTGDGDRLPFDALVIAVGARAAHSVPGAHVFAGPQDVPALTEMLDAAARGEVRAIAFAIAPGVAWTLPVYELAIMTAVDLRSRGAGDVEITVVTPEAEPLHLFGSAASSAVAGLLRDRGIRLLGGRAAWVEEDRLVLERGASVAADATVVLPPVQGPWIEGLPNDEHGFIPVDRHGRVTGAAGVYAAGDATSFPIKQGGLAAQQADAAAAAVAADLGLCSDAPPFRPVLRGLLLTGGAPLYLRAELEDKDAVGRSRISASRVRGESSTRALWWPPGKVAGRYLAPYLATARPIALGRKPLLDRAASATHEPAPDADAALELALMLADEDARTGDLSHALHALDAAAALAGGILPADAAQKRATWRAALERASRR